MKGLASVQPLCPALNRGKIIWVLFGLGTRSNPERPCLVFGFFLCGIVLHARRVAYTQCYDAIKVEVAKVNPTVTLVGPEIVGGGWDLGYMTYFLDKKNHADNECGNDKLQHAPFFEIVQNRDLRCILHPSIFLCWVQNTPRIQNNNV